MASDNAKAVALEVIQTVRNGTKVNKGKIIRKHGYSESVSKHPPHVTETLSYKGVITPVVLALEEERLAIIERLKVTRDKAKYRDLIDGLDKVTKNHQLLTGHQTENIAIIATLEEREVINKAIDTYLN